MKSMTIELFDIVVAFAIQKNAFVIQNYNVIIRQIIKEIAQQCTFLSCKSRKSKEKRVFKKELNYL